MPTSKTEAFIVGDLMRSQIDPVAQDGDQRQARIARAVERTVERFPPLTSGQRTRLTRILRVEAEAEDAGAA